MRLFHWMGKHFSDRSRNHKHRLELKATQEEMWLECSCGYQEDIPTEKEELAYKKLRNNDTSWEY